MSRDDQESRPAQPKKWLLQLVGAGAVALALMAWVCRPNCTNRFGQMRAAQRAFEHCCGPAGCTNQCQRERSVLLAEQAAYGTTCRAAGWTQ